MPTLLTRPFVLLTIAHFLQALGFATMTMLPLYLDHLGASRSQVGVIMAANAFGGLLLRPAVGWSLDALGRKPTLVAGTLVLVAAMLMVGFVDRIGPLILSVRLLIGVGGGALFTGYFAFAADLIPEKRRTEGIALFGISGLLPLALNPFFGELGLEAPDLRWFYPAVGIAIASSLLFVRSLEEPNLSRPRQPVRAAEVIAALRSPPLWSVWLATVVFAGLVATFMAFSTVTAASRGVDRSTALWLTYAAGAVGVRLFGARLPDRLGTANMVAPALGLYGAAMLLSASATTTAGFLIAGLLAGLGHGSCFPVLTSQVISRSPERLRGSALAMFTAIWELSSVTLTPAFGLLADATDDRTMFAAVAACAACGVALWAAVEHRVQPRVP